MKLSLRKINRSLRHDARPVWWPALIMLVLFGLAQPLCLLEHASAAPVASDGHAHSHSSHGDHSDHHDDHSKPDSCCSERGVTFAVAVAQAAPHFELSAMSSTPVAFVAVVPPPNRAQFVLLSHHGRDGPPRALVVLRSHSSSLFSRPPPQAL